MGSHVFKVDVVDRKRTINFLGVGGAVQVVGSVGMSGVKVSQMNFEKWMTVLYMDKIGKDIPSRDSNHVQKSKVVNGGSEFADVKLKLKGKSG